MTDLLELAARCEVAEGPDRGLDVRISDALGGDFWPLDGCGHFDDWVVPIGREWVSVSRHPRGYIMTTGDRMVLRYTASIDAAMSLVPETECCCLSGNDLRDGRSLATVSIKRGEVRSASVWAATPALALCAAALRARHLLAKGDALEGRG